MPYDIQGGYYYNLWGFVIRGSDLHPGIVRNINKIDFGFSNARIDASGLTLIHKLLFKFIWLFLEGLPFYISDRGALENGRCETKIKWLENSEVFKHRGMYWQQQWSII